MPKMSISELLSMICTKDIFELCIADIHMMLMFHQLNSQSPKPKNYDDILDRVRTVEDIDFQPKVF